MSRKEYITAWSKCIGYFVAVVVLVIAIANRGTIRPTLAWSAILVVLGGWFLWVQDWRWRKAHRGSKGQ